MKERGAASATLLTSPEDLFISTSLTFVKKTLGALRSVVLLSLATPKSTPLYCRAHGSNRTVSLTRLEFSVLYSTPQNISIL